MDTGCQEEGEGERSVRGVAWTSRRVDGHRLCQEEGEAERSVRGVGDALVFTWVRLQPQEQRYAVLRVYVIL